MELVLLALAVVLGALVKSLTGLGLPLLVVPVLAQVVGVREAVVIMAPPTLLTNAWMTWRYRAHLPGVPNLPRLLAASVAGGVAGAWALDRVNERALALVLAAAVLAYVARLLRDPDVRLPERVARALALPVGLAAGALQGATGISGPVVSTYVHAQGLPRERFVVAVSALFGVSGLAQTVTLASVGRFTPPLLARAGLACLGVAIVMGVGMRLADRLSPRFFERLVVVILLLSGLRLLADGLGLG